MKYDAFEKLVKEEYQSLPPFFLNKIDNLILVIEDEPDEETVLELELNSSRELYGLYYGVPVSEREDGTPVLPDQIILYRKNLVRDYPGNKLKKAIRDTLMHELAHYFGITDEELEKEGLY